MLAGGQGPAEARIEVAPVAVEPRWRAWTWMPVNALQILAILAWTAVCITLALLALVLGAGDRRLPLGMARWLWAPPLCWLAGARLEVVGRERVDFRRPHFFVANHQSLMDIPALFRALPVGLHFVIKQELRRVPFLGAYCAAMGMIFVDRGAGPAAWESMRRAGALIRDGRSVMSFPEGTRSADGAVARFKQGVFAAAVEAGVPVVPVRIDGASAVMPARRAILRPGRIRVAVGEPMATKTLTGSDRAALAEAARAAIEALAPPSVRPAG